MDKNSGDPLGRYDEMELIELNEADVYGGTTIGCASLITAITSIATAVSAATCPTTKCTSKC